MDTKTKKRRARFTVTRRTIAIFFISLLVGAVFVAAMVRNKMDVDRVTVEQLITEKSSSVAEVISRLLYKTQALETLAIQSDGEVSDFENVAAALLDDDAILNVLLAPDGVVSMVYPMEGNAGVLGLDFFQEGAGNIEARLAKETGELVFGGPFTLVQGGQALVGRLPVWKENPSGSREFWGIVSVTLKYPEALEGAGLESLVNQGLAYEIWRINPDNGQRQVIAQSAEYDDNAQYIEKEVSILNAKWYFRISPLRRWYQYPETWLMGLIGLCVCLLVAFIVENNARLQRMKLILEEQEIASRKAAHTAEEASRMKSTFLATVSHEIRTPMNGIIGFSDLAMENPALPATARDYLANIERSAKGLMRIIDDLLDISKIEAGKVELESIPFTVQKVFEECITINSPKAMEKGIGLHSQADPAAREWVLGDPTRLRQILLNLLANAIKFTGIGAVEMTCTAQDDADANLSLTFSIKDSGIGMTREQIDRIGESFTQADSSTTRKYGGTGLGLSISKNLIELMGGRLQVDSAPGVGSRFSFTVGFVKATREDLERAEEAGQTMAGKPVFSGAVLVCEDIPANQDLAREHMTRAGLQVTIAANGRQGVELVQQGKEARFEYDLIFMDIQMPVMDGVEAARALRELGCETPIVAMTANVMDNDLQGYRDAGMEDCLAKPFSGDDLRQCLLRHLQPVAFELPSPPGRPAAPAEKTAVIHRDLGLKLTDGDEEWYERLLLRFANDNADSYTKIANALRKGDSKQAMRLAHSLKGMANMIGAARLASAAARVEQAVQQQDDDATLEKQMGLLKSELDAVLFELQATA